MKLIWRVVAIAPILYGLRSIRFATGPDDALSFLGAFFWFSCACFVCALGDKS